MLLSVRTKRNAMGRIRDLTPRPWGRTLQACILEINAWVIGWHQFFRSCEPGEEYVLRALDAHIRRRLRAILLHHWKRRPTIVRNLIALGIKPRAGVAGRLFGARRSLWALSHIPQVDRALRPRYFTDRGLLSLVELHRAWHEEIAAPTTSNWRWSGDRARSRKAAGGGVRNPPSRGAVCEQHKHGSVGAGAGNRPGYPTEDRRRPDDSPTPLFQVVVDPAREVGTRATPRPPSQKQQQRDIATAVDRARPLAQRPAVIAAVLGKRRFAADVWPGLALILGGAWVGRGLTGVA